MYVLYHGVFRTLARCRKPLSKGEILHGCVRFSKNMKSGGFKSRVSKRLRPARERNLRNRCQEDSSTIRLGDTKFVPRLVLKRACSGGGQALDEHGPPLRPAASRSPAGPRPSPWVDGTWFWVFLGVKCRCFRCSRAKWDGRVTKTKKAVVRLLPIAERAKQLSGEDGAQTVASRLEQEMALGTNPLQGRSSPKCSTARDCEPWAAGAAA